MNKKGYWLGFLFIVALTILLYGTLTVGSINLFAKPQQMRVHFDTVQGMKKGDDVRVEGVVLGKVVEIRLDDKSGVIALLRLDTPVTLTDTHRITIESFSVLGGSYVSITRGTGRALTAKEMEFLPGSVTPGPLEALSLAVNDNREDLRKVMMNVRDTFAETKKLIETINKGEGTLGALVKDRTLYDDTHKLLVEVQRAADNLKKASADIAELTDKVRNGGGSISKLINTDELHQELVKTVASLREQLQKTADEVQKAAAGVHAALDKVNGGEGVVARMLNDKKVADDLAATVEKLKAITTNLEQITGKVARGEGTVGKLVQDDTIAEMAKKVLKDMNNTVGRVANAKVSVGAQGLTFFDTESSISRLFFRLEPDSTKYFQIGASFVSLTADAKPITFDDQITKGEDQSYIKLDLMASYKIPWFFDNHVALRIGAFESKPGGALDVNFELLNHEFFASFEIRDAYGSVEKEDIDENISGSMTRLWLTTPLWNKDPKEWWQQILYAMKLTAGVSRLQDNPEFAIGIGLEYTDEDLRTLMGLISTAK